MTRSTAGNLPLHYAACHNHTFVAERLFDALEHGYDRSYPPAAWENREGMAPSAVALQHGHTKLAYFMRQREEELATRRSERPKPRHFKARSDVAMQMYGYPRRFRVPDWAAEWRTPFPEYEPVAFTAATVIDNDRQSVQGGWADPQDPQLIPRDEWQRRKSHEGAITIVHFGILRDWPRNPRGRTGMGERGLLGAWGPNHAADPLVTREHPDHPGALQLCATMRPDGKTWSLPGGFVANVGDGVPVKVLNEFKAEVDLLEAERLFHKAKVLRTLQEKLFQSGNVVYQGYVDDPRNTDHAWIETSATHYHMEPPLSHMMTFSESDEPGAFRWIDVDPDDPRYKAFFSGHAEFVERVNFHFTAKLATSNR